jgi:cyclase
MRIFPVVALCLASLATVSSAQVAEVVIKPETLAPGIAVLFGQGGNIGVSYGEDGTVLIDDQFAPLTPKIEAAIAALGAKPVKFLINTHWHGDHSGGNENFGNSGAIIMAQDNVRARLAAGSSTPPRIVAPAAKGALPVITWAEGISLHLNGDDVRTMHLHNGHTDGDSIIIWEKANVLHTGDLFFNKVTLPFIDLASGGSAQGMLAAAEKMLSLTNAQTKIIPGHGPVATRADLIAYRDMLKTVIGKVQAAIKAKTPLAAIKAAKPAAAYEVKGGFISGDVFVETVYKSLTAPPPADHM